MASTSTSGSKISSASNARAKSVSALRRLGRAFLGHRATNLQLEAMAAEFTALADELESMTLRRRSLRDWEARMRRAPDGAGPVASHFLECFVSGDDNPVGLDLQIHRHDGIAAAHWQAERPYVCAPDCIAPGMLAAVFDDVFAYLFTFRAELALTGSIAVRQLAEVRVGDRLDFRAEISREDGRRVSTVGEARREGELVATAEAVFVRPSGATGPPLTPGPDAAASN